MKPVLFFHHNNDYTGSTRVLADVIARDYAGQSVPVVVNKNHGKGFLSELSNVRLIGIWKPLYAGRPIPLLSGQVVRMQGFLLALIYGWRYETFYINTIVPFYAALVGRFYGKRIVYHVHEKFVSLSLPVRVMEYVFAHTIAKRIYVSKYTMSRYTRHPRCEEEIRYNRLSQDFISKVRICPLSERRRDTVLMIASLSKIKGIFNFLRVASLAPGLRFRLMLSADMDTILDFITEPVPANVELISAQSNIHPYLYETDLMLNMSIPLFGVETFGMTILEAMAYGIPSIVPNVGGPTELIEDGCNGYCVDVTDVELVASKVRDALERENYERLCEGALDRFEKFIAQRKCFANFSTLIIPPQMMKSDV